MNNVLTGETQKADSKLSLAGDWFLALVSNVCGDIQVIVH